MIFLIVAINLSITFLNVYIAIRIWQLRRLIVRIADILINYENYFNFVLKATPIIIGRGQSNIYQVRRQYQLFQLQVTKIRQLIWLLNWSYRAWRNI